jgi:tetratricopeptide (TPR) repeat protein
VKEPKLAIEVNSRKPISVDNLIDNLSIGRDFAMREQALSILESNSIEIEMEEASSETESDAENPLIYDGLTLEKRATKLLQGLERACNEDGKAIGELELAESRIKYAQFEKDILVQYKDNSISKNPGFATREGNFLVEQGNYAEAVKHYERAIAGDPIYSFAASYNKAYGSIESNNKSTAGPKADLLRAKQILEDNLIPQYNSMSLLIKELLGFEQNADLSIRNFQ